MKRFLAVFPIVIAALLLVPAATHAQNSLTIMDASTPGMSSVTVDVNMTNDDTVEGFVLAICVDETLVAVTNVSIAGTVTESTAVLVTETAGGKLALLADQLAYHHIAQGSERGEPWMVSF